MLFHMFMMRVIVSGHQILWRSGGSWQKRLSSANGRV